jgi:hypothetical protein
MNHYLAKGKLFIEKIPTTVLVLLFSLFIYGSVEDSIFKLAAIHQNILLTLIGLLIVGIFNVRSNNMSILLSFLILNFLNETHIFHTFANWLFFKSSFIHLFDKLAAKDANIIFLICIVLLSVIMFLMEIYSILFKKKYNLKRMFTLITSGAIILTTVIFHYYIINYNFTQESNKIKEEMLNVAKLNPVNIPIICKYQKYTCFVTRDIKNFEGYPSYIYDFAKKNISNNYTTIASYPVENGKFMNVVRVGNIWVFDNNRYNQAFQNASDIFLSLCLWAHSFWMLFLAFLLIFHGRKKRVLQKT